MWPGGSGPHLLDLNILLLVCPQSQSLFVRGLLKTPYPILPAPVAFRSQICGSPQRELLLAADPRPPSPCPGKSSCELA